MLLLSLLISCRPDGLKPGESLSDFALVDVNPNSESYNNTLQFSEFEQRVSAWYFGHAT